MKFWTFAGVVAGLFFLALAAKKDPPRSMPVRQVNDPNSRYDVDDLIIDQEL